MPALAGRLLRIRVCDTGRWRTPPADPGHRGRGIAMMRALVARAEITASAHGTEVTLLTETVPAAA